MSDVTAAGALVTSAPAPRKCATKARGRPFQPGNAGKPKGTRHKVTLAVEALLEGEVEALTRRAVAMALAGDTVAMRLCLERIAPARKDRPVSFSLPAIETTGDVVTATHALLKAVASGELTPMEAAGLGKLVDAHVRAIEVTDIQERLARLEQAQR
jgi:hypothetical protein